MEMTQEQIATLIQGLSDFIPQASKWEQGFFESVQSQFEKRHSLSPRQIDTVQKIANKFSPEAIKRRETWYASWSEEKAETLRVCAEYYKYTDYYKDLVERILNDSKFVPSPKQYKMVCENKYAAKVLEAYRAEPKFSVGSLATLRKIRSNGYMAVTGAPPWTDVNVLVLSTSEPIVSSAIGCKRYKCVVVGGTDTFYCEERDLKKMRKGKK